MYRGDFYRRVVEKYFLCFFGSVVKTGCYFTCLFLLCNLFSEIINEPFYLENASNLTNNYFMIILIIFFVIVETRKRKC